MHIIIGNIIFCGQHSHKGGGSTCIGQSCEGLPWITWTQFFLVTPLAGEMDGKEKPDGCILLQECIHNTL